MLAGPERALPVLPLTSPVSNMTPHFTKAPRTSEPRHGGSYYLKLAGCLLVLGLLYTL
ncbi:hypothetical protein ACU4GI_05270 [Cupriavidus basilensis]|jgi:hypothetical protein|uniref:hypothetical protein n=1 Tax=Cupriavidus sp. SK-3 TaxID=1470558 RepID=UPI000A697C24|nr:hypothetical protein [Cupriavidus sp. SK-3]